jgi:elongation factor P
MLSLSDIKTGQKIVLENEHYEVIFHEHSKTGRHGAVLRTKLKNLITGAVQDKTFQGSDKVNEADISKSKAQYLYQEGDNFIFMDQEIFDQFSLSKDTLGEVTNYLTEGLEVSLLNFNGNPINVEVPAKVVLLVTDAPPATKGNTQSGGDKLVTTETGLKVTTPLFVETGDKIIINTERNIYVSKFQE